MYDVSVLRTFVGSLSDSRAQAKRSSQSKNYENRAILKRGVNIALIFIYLFNFVYYFFRLKTLFERLIRRESESSRQNHKKPLSKISVNIEEKISQHKNFKTINVASRIYDARNHEILVQDSGPGEAVAPKGAEKTLLPHQAKKAVGKEPCHTSGSRRLIGTP